MENRDDLSGLELGPQVITVGGLSVPLEQTAFGPRLASGGDDSLDWLQWVVNAGLYGDIQGLAESVERGETRDDGVVFARPAGADDDLAAARQAWQQRTGGELGDDVYVLSVRWRGDAFYVPRPVLVELIRRLEAMRAATPKPPPPWLFALAPVHYDAHPEEEATLRALEGRAREFDTFAAAPGDLDHAATVAARRRFLLAELSYYGLLSGPMGKHRVRWLERWQLPTLLGYQQASLAIGYYWSSMPRRRRIGPPPQVPSVLGASVSVDWYRLPAPAPQGWDPDDWLAFCERTLLDASPVEGQEGDIYVHQGDARVMLTWRRDDGVNPCVVRARTR